MRETSGNSAGRHSPLDISAAMDAIRLIIIDNNDQVRSSLVERMSREPTVSIIGATGDASEAARLASSLNPDVVLLDLKSQNGGGIDLCQNLAAATHAPVLILTSYLSRKEWDEARGAGARDYHLKQIGFDALLSKIRRLARR